jgi:predicted CXXCH cytochrome family protein
MNQVMIFGLILFLRALFATGVEKEDILRFSGEESCIDCHSDLMGQEVKHPVASDACDNCHQSTGASHPEEGVRGFTLMDRIPDLCFYCHEEFGAFDVQHLPVARGECLSCHDAHSSSVSALLKSAERELCLSCHNREYKSDSSRTGNIGRQVTIPQLEHSAISGGGCLFCHKPHHSEHRSLLTDVYPPGTYVEGDPDHYPLCFQCHDPDLIIAEETEWGTAFRDGTRNLHSLHVKGTKGRNCRLCHNLHGSAQKFLIEESVVFGEWVMEMKYVSNENGGSCLPGCHGYQNYSR